MEEKGKLFFMKAYFDKLQKKITFLETLNQQGKTEEALTLCCCYIEALGSRISKNQDNPKKKNYCNILTTHSDDKLWGLLHPKPLNELLVKQKIQSKICSSIIGEALICPEYFQRRVGSKLSESEQKNLKDNLYQASIASISYKKIRSELVHDIECLGIFFSTTRYNGHEINLDFSRHYDSLKQITSKIKDEAESNNSWWNESL